jgi:iron complex outermembrane receptor protein
MRRLSKFLLPVSAVALAMPWYATTAQAQQGNDEIEEVIVTGLRGKPRSAVDSAVPIDTFDADSIEAVAHTDTVDILQTLVPSYNVSREPISDGLTFIRAPELRGLPSHHTLVLINGKRRHRSSLVEIGGAGTQGPDVATVPSAAIQSIEVLRDGASSQYGSDAIAGVINFNLKENSEGVSLSADFGSYFEGDGDSYTVTGNVGLPLGENGFLSVSAEMYDADYSERAEPYCESWFCVDPSNERFSGSNSVSRAFVEGNPVGINVGDEGDSGYVYTAESLVYIQPFVQGYPDGTLNPHSASVVGENVMPWGQPNTDRQAVFLNAGYEISDSMEVYGWGSYTQSGGDGSFFHRYPHNGTIEFLREADGSLYIPLEKFPGGFTPRFEGEIEDMSAAGGIRGENGNGFAWDASVRYGSNEIDYRLFNTINPSMGPDSPTDFKPGRLQNEELQFQLDFSNEFDAGTASPVVFAYGLSWMDETYNVHESSDVASYIDGPYALPDPWDLCNDDGTPTDAGAAIASLDCADSGDPVYQVVGVGANGFPGFSPDFSGEYNRDSYAVYGDLSTDVTDRLFLQAAVRYEDYSDFGDELVGKVAARFRLNDQFALRGSYGTGFRAPTPGQQGTTNVSTRLPNGFPVATGLFPASGDVAQALGATPLKAETSTSFTLGLTADIENLTVTIDYYNIDVDDRFAAISTRDVSTDPTSGEAYENYLALAAAGVVGAESIGGVFYFTNAYDSNTKGVDVVLSYPLEWNNGQSTNIQWAMNWNESKLTSDASDFLNEEDAYDFANYDPNIRWNFTAMHDFNEQFSLTGRVRYYGESHNSDRNSSVLPALFIQTHSATTYIDLEANYRINDNWRLTVGGRNIMDEYPDREDRIASDNDNCCGRTYRSGGVLPWQGGYWYGRVTVDF